MAINVSTFENNLTTKINNTSGTTAEKEFLLLAKAVEATNSAITNTSLSRNNNLSDVADLALARTNLGVVGASGGTFTGDVTVTGNLTVSGTQTVINSATLSVDDLNITVADGAADAAAANGAGLTVDGANATIEYASASDTWDLNKPIKGSYKQLHPHVEAVSSSATTQTFSLNNPLTHMTMTAAAQYTASDVAAGRTSMMVLDTTATPFTPTWGTDIKWPDASEPSWADQRYWVITFTALNGVTVLASASGYTV